MTTDQRTEAVMKIESMIEDAEERHRDEIKSLIKLLRLIDESCDIACEIERANEIASAGQLGLTEMVEETALRR